MIQVAGSDSLLLLQTIDYVVSVMIAAASTNIGAILSAEIHRETTFDDLTLFMSHR